MNILVGPEDQYFLLSQIIGQRLIYNIIVNVI